MGEGRRLGEKGREGAWGEGEGEGWREEERRDVDGGRG